MAAVESAAVGWVVVEPAVVGWVGAAVAEAVGGALVAAAGTAAAVAQ